MGRAGRELHRTRTCRRASRGSSRERRRRTRAVPRRPKRRRACRPSPRPAGDQSSVPRTPNERSAFAMKALNIDSHAGPSAAACRASSATLLSSDVVRNAAEPSGYAAPVGSSVFRYSSPRRSSSGFSSAYAGEPVKSGCQDASTSCVKPGTVRSVDVRIHPPSSASRSRTQTLQPAFESSAAPASALIPEPTNTASNPAMVRERNQSLLA